MVTSKQNQGSPRTGWADDINEAAKLEGLVSLLLGLEFTNPKSSPAGEPRKTEAVSLENQERREWPSSAPSTSARQFGDPVWEMGRQKGRYGYPVRDGRTARSTIDFEAQQEKQYRKQSVAQGPTVESWSETAKKKNYEDPVVEETVANAMEALRSMLLGSPQGEKNPRTQKVDRPRSPDSTQGSSEGLLVMKAELESSVPPRPRRKSSGPVSSEILVTESEVVSPKRTPARESDHEVQNIGESDHEVQNIAASLEVLEMLLTGRPKQQPEQQKPAKPEASAVKISVESEIAGPQAKGRIGESDDLSEAEKLVHNQARSSEEQWGTVGTIEDPKDRQRTWELSEKETLTEQAEPEVESLVQTAASSLEQISGLESGDLQDAIAKMEEKLANIERQTGVINPLMPLVSELVGMDLTLSREESIRVLVPIIDKVIEQRSKEDREAMSAVLAELLPGAISKQIENSPQDIAKAIAPEMSAAIKEQMRIEKDSISEALAPEMGRAIKSQIVLERDSMVDALYPVIGGTISKYLAEVISSINEKVENTLSPEGIKRKIRAKIQGVSEAELMLQESKPFATQAVFLIHKESGLVIAEAKPDSEQGMESEMVAGMLTAIRSFVNDCIVQSGEISELDAIDYGEAKILLEVAGYSYLAVVVKGEPSKQFIRTVRQTLSTIVGRYGKQVCEFDGDRATIPEEVVALVEKLLQTSSKAKASKSPNTLVMLVLALLSAAVIPWGMNEHRAGLDRRLEEQTAAALLSAPELSVYKITVEAADGAVKLTGRVPNEYLRLKAEAIVKNQVPSVEVDNQIIAVEVPPDPVLAAAEVERVTKLLNNREGVSISTRYEGGNVTVKGTVFEVKDAQQIPQTLDKIPGVSSVFSTIQLKINPLDTRIYFDLGSAELHPADNDSKLGQIKEFMNEYPQMHLMLIGHSDKIGNWAENQRLSLRRAQAVKSSMEQMGVDPRRLQVFGTAKEPPDVSADAPPELSRCVRFELFVPVGQGE